MEKISVPVVKRDHASKVSGRSVYVGDYDDERILMAKTLRSKYPRARIISVKIPELPDGYFYVDKNDVPGVNEVHMIKDDTHVFAEEIVEYIGEPIGLVVGRDEKIVDKLLDEFEVEYEELEPVLDFRTATEAHFDYHYGRGDVDKAFAEADKVYEEEFFTGYQDQAYIEPQGMMAEPEADGRLYIHGSMQCAFYVQSALLKVLNCEAKDIHVYQDVTGGGFGGKESFPSLIACQVAVAAKKVNAPVRLIYNRKEDMSFSSHRHPALNTYKVAVKDGKVTAMDIDVKFNGGAYTTLSAVVLQRGIICSSGVYTVPNLRVHGRAIKTNTTPSGAYRGFGAPQTFFCAERIMDHIAQDLGIDSIEFKEANMAKQGDLTATSGKFHFHVPLPEMIDEIDKLCDLRRKHKEYASMKQEGRYRKGIGMAVVFHGAGFTGSAERDLIKAVAKLRKNADGTVDILAGNGEIGQGLRTTLPKIVAKELELPLERIRYDHPDTSLVPDSGPTVASRSLMIVGELLRRASIKLKEIWKDGEEQIVEEHYKQPDFMIPFDLATFHGDAYPTYAWAVNAIEVEVDTYTGLTKVLGAYGNFDVGTPIDYNIVLGQMEGGFLQSIGSASTEIMDYDSKGRFRNTTFSDYLIPTAADVQNMQCILHVDKYPYGPYGAKGAGELPMVPAPSAYVEAIEMALGHGTKIYHSPFSPEDTLKAVAAIKEGK